MLTQNMLTKEAIAELVHQQYRIVGDNKHTAVKICGWTKNTIKRNDSCYKLKFYGIMSHQCLQMSPSISCANRCVFCWRGYKAPVSKEWKWAVDDPKTLIDESEKAHHSLLVGFPGDTSINKKAYEESKTIRHVALSLTGEPIIYPKINEMIEEYHKRGISTFLVTNAQYAEEIKKLAPVTQLYLSVDAPTKELLKEIDKPLFSNYWGRMEQSLEYLSEKKQRTAIRLTLIKDMNMCNYEDYARLIHKGNPDFIEVKSYMFVGASRQRLKKSNMPFHEDIVEFSNELIKHLVGYEIVSEHITSRVILLAKTKFKIDGKWHTWIDFNKFHELANSFSRSGVIFTTDEYLKETPIVGITGKGTIERLNSHTKLKKIKKYD